MHGLKWYLRQAYGPQASFRDGQKEAIKAVLRGQKTLLVERTGWGKSLVYFLSAKILRDQGKGPCFIISPLLALMRNQMEEAKRFGLRAETINSNNKSDWASIYKKMGRNEIDVLFISPERLANNDFLERVLGILHENISMLVIDEAHCISDWGHDFRPDYLRIVKIVQLLPSNVPLLATTATANDRVIKDIQQQFRNDLHVLRGPLARESLHIQILQGLHKKEERMAWLAENLPNLPGTGIIYCLTTSDCEMVARWLQSRGLAAAAYHAGRTDRHELEDDFFHNRLKALVATVALGMGVDKSDIRFIVHFQMPANIIAYYQQIGRAGRDGHDAYAFLMMGDEDDVINQYFIRSAFPQENETQQLLQVLDNAEDGLKKTEIMEALNLSEMKIEQILKLLQIGDFIYKDASKYYRSAKKWHSDAFHASLLTKLRQDELHEMHEYVLSKDCYTKWITRSLNDPEAHACGKCGNCRPESRFPSVISPELVQEAAWFIRNHHVQIKPRKKWGDGRKIPNDKILQPGYALSNYADDGWGKLVKDDKYVHGRFSEKLIHVSVEILKSLCDEWQIDVVTAVPSLRHPHLVPDFARAVAARLCLPYEDGLVKCKNVSEQKKQQNSAWQCRNASDSFEVTKSYSGNVLLIDDMVDSRWTLTVCGAKIIDAGASKVFPFALANSGTRG